MQARSGRSGQVTGFADGFLPGWVQDYLSLVVAVTVLVLSALVGTVAELLGFPIVGGMAVVFGLAIAACTVLFVTVPVELLRRFTS